MTPDTATGVSPDDMENLKQEVRLAVVMTGGVSLAIWMGGVARELNLLLCQGTPKGTAVQIRDCYKELVDLLGVRVSMDVLSGTSAGGINAAILALANVNDADIGLLRDLWMQQGAFGRLLRNPNQPPTPSLLQGDAQLLRQLRDGLLNIVTAATDGAAGQPPPRHRPVTDVFITTTFLDGEPSRFVDDYGTLVSDVDHHGLFHFDTEQLAGDQAARRLALAARCSASFPVAFEPAHLTIGESPDDMHPDMQDLSNATSSRYVADGGLLANRPIAAAVRAVFDRPAHREVRRVLLYVVPTAAPEKVSVSPVAPLLGTAVIKDLQAMTSQAITADLAGIRAHNESIRVRLDTVRQLAMIGRRITDGGLVTDGLYRQYRERVADGVAGELAEEALGFLDTSQLPLDGDSAGGEDATGSRPPRGQASGPGGPVGEAAEHLRADVASAVAGLLPAAPPAAGDFAALGRLSRRGYDAAKVIALDLVSRAYQARPDRKQRQWLADVRRAVHEALPPPPPAGAMDGAAVVAAAGEGRQALARWLAGRWAAGQQTAGELAEGWRQLAGTVAGAVPVFDVLLAAGSGDKGHDPVLAYLGADAAAIAGHLADLHIAQTALLPETGIADQRLELVEVSADTGTRLDSRRWAGEKLTGLQLHHFGAFYKYSWRANDWMWGRLDGAGWLVHVLLDPRRLRALRKLDDDPAGFPQRLTDGLRRLASAGGEGGDPAIPAEVSHELGLVFRDDEPALASLPETAKWVAAGIQRLILDEELRCVAEQIEVDAKAGASVNPAAAAFAAAMAGPSADAASLLAACRVSDETFEGEKSSRLFKKTFKQTALVTVAALVASDKVPGLVKIPLRALRLELRLLPVGLLTGLGDLARRLWPGRGTSPGRHAAGTPGGS